MDASGRITVLGISGSLRSKSLNTALLRAAQELAPEGMSIEITSLAGIPLYNDDVQQSGPPQSVVRLKEEIRRADGVLFASPEYNYSVTGVLKNAIDWISRPPKDTPLREKPAAIIGASQGISGTIRSQTHLRQILVSTRTHVLLAPEIIMPRSLDSFDDVPRLTDETTREILRTLLAEFAKWIARFPRPA